MEENNKTIWGKLLNGDSNLIDQKGSWEDTSKFLVNIYNVLEQLLSSTDNCRHIDIGASNIAVEKLWVESKGGIHKVNEAMKPFLQLFSADIIHVISHLYRIFETRKELKDAVA